jgi:uncharacterized repeat protein (TIGR01451 family)
VPATAELAGDSAISQSVQVPEGSGPPTLSFLYRLTGSSSTGDRGLGIAVSDEVSATEIVTLTVDTTDWTHAWVDMTPWAGKTLTLTLSVHQTAGEPAVRALLDEISLGSAYPDVWAGMSGPAAALPDSPIVYTIHYGNRGGVLAAGVRVTDTLPAEISFVSAEPSPEVVSPPLLAWNIGDLPAESITATIRITGTVKSDAQPFAILTNNAETGAASAELELTNNQAQTQTVVAWLSYLPVVMR